MTRWPLLLLAFLLAACDAPAEPWLQGYVEGEYLRIGAPEAGWVERVAVRRGDRVEAGDPLFALESAREQAAVAAAEARLAQARASLADLRTGKRPEEVAQLEARLEEARAALAYAEIELARQERLSARDVAAEARLDQARAAAEEARARVAAVQAEIATARLAAREDQIAAAEAAAAMAEAALAEARWDLDQRTVRAPAAALVQDRLREPGEWVPAGGTVVSLLPPGNVKVRFFVPEPMVGSLAVGDPLRLRCDGCPDGLTATLRYIAPEAEFTPPVIYSVGNREKLVFMAEAWPAPGTALNPGQPVDIARAGSP